MLSAFYHISPKIPIIAIKLLDCTMNTAHHEKYPINHIWLKILNHSIQNIQGCKLAG
ncbi:hypothetical protein FJZ33_13175 [Candidatus Poribacteria bacterium]|nr:hypothetical protein [Candidatus Poribacteria bacterium]